MEKKLTIAHLAPYLPYGLKARCKSGDYGVITSLDYDDNSLGIKFDNQTHMSFRRELQDVSPILRPLSRLTQEIEHNGERFVPVDKLEDMFRWNPEWFGWETFIKDANLNSLDYDVIQQLIKWHFDIFQLCDSGLAIEKGAEG